MKKAALIAIAAVVAVAPAGGEAAQAESSKRCPAGALCVWTKTNYEGKKAVVRRQASRISARVSTTGCPQSRTEWTSRPTSIRSATGKAKSDALHPVTRSPTSVTPTTSTTKRHRRRFRRGQILASRSDERLAGRAGIAGAYHRPPRARSSVGERSLHTREVGGSKPPAPMQLFRC